MDQPGKGCQSCSWSAEQGKLIFPCPRACLRIWSRETSSAVPSRTSLLISVLRPNLVTNYGIPPELQLKKLQGHNKSAIDLSNASPAHGHKDIPRSTSHVMVTTRYSDQQEFKSRKKLCDSSQVMGPTNIKMIHQNSLRHIESSLDRLGLSSPTHD